MDIFTNKYDCTGCSACMNVCSQNAISMQADAEGFLYPVVDQNACIECGLCKKICPMVSDTHQNDVIRAYAAHYAVDDDVWYNSSSGGLFFAMCEYVIAHKGVVYGAKYDVDFVVKHDSAVDIDDVLKFRGSKYSQSDLQDIFKSVKGELEAGRLVLFSGTPCQVSGLRSYLLKEYNNLLTVDLICHCVPSPLLFKDYINYIEEKYKSRIKRLNMKDKASGWPKQSLRITFEDGSSLFENKDALLWAQIFYSHVGIRYSCSKCRFSNLRRTGDVTIGDFWGVEKLHPEYNNPKGASILLINTSRGQTFFENIKDKLACTETDAKAALPSTLVYSPQLSPLHDEFWREYGIGGFHHVCSKYFDEKVEAKPKSKHRRFSLRNKIKKLKDACRNINIFSNK